jgi:hypothetical protein
MDSGPSRMDRIYTIISESRFSIHDLSRVELSSAGLPRMNMPLEFGVCLGARYFGGDEHRKKVCLVLDVEAQRYHKFISDVSGQDIQTYNSDISLLIGILRNFLSGFVDGFLPGDKELQARYVQYRAALPHICAKLNLTEKAASFSERQKIIYVSLKAFQRSHLDLETAYRFIALMLPENGPIPPDPK